MALFSSWIDGAPADSWYNGDPTVAGNPLMQLGTMVTTRDGRIYRWCKAGASNLVAGNMIQAAAQVANHLAMTPAAAAIGATAVTVTPGNTAGVANLYAEGYLVVDTTPGNGIAYAISSHLAITGSTAFVVNLRQDDPIQVALTTSSRLNIYQNPFNSVIQTPVTTLTSAAIGCAPTVITAAFNGWLQTWGVAAALIQGTPAVGQALVCPASAAGALAIASGTLNAMAVSLETGVDGKNHGVLLYLG